MSQIPGNSNSKRGLANADKTTRESVARKGGQASKGGGNVRQKR